VIEMEKYINIPCAWDPAIKGNKYGHLLDAAGLCYEIESEGRGNELGVSFCSHHYRVELPKNLDSIDCGDAEMTAELQQTIRFIKDEYGE